MKRDQGVGWRALAMSAMKEVVARPSPKPPMKRRLWGLAMVPDVYSNVVRVSVYRAC